MMRVAPPTIATIPEQVYSVLREADFQEASYAAWQPGQNTIPDNTWWQTEIIDVSDLAGNNPDVRFGLN